MNIDYIQNLLTAHPQIIPLHLKQVENICQRAFNAYQEIAQAATEISLATNRNILIIAIPDTNFSYDYYTNGQESFWLSSQRDNTVAMQADPLIISTAIQICIDKKVEGYPTWEFADGSRKSGEVPLAELSQKTGCPLPK